MKLPNPDKIACRNCKWGRICGILNQSCTKYELKPDSIYYDNKKCKFFEMSQGAIIEQGKTKKEETFD